MAACAPPAPPPTSQPVGTAFQRIVSVTLAGDEMLLDLVEPSRIAALSTFPDDPFYSNVVEQARVVEPRVQASAEPVLALNPDLVIYASYNNPEFVSLIERAGVATFRLEDFDSLDQILDNYHQLARRVGEGQKSGRRIEAVRMDLEQLLRKTSQLPRPSLLYYDHGWIAGAGTVQDEMIRIAGGENYALRHGIEGTRQMSSEALQAWTPDVIVIVGNETRRLEPSEVSVIAPPLANLPAAREGRTWEVPSRILTAASHYAVQGPALLAELLHPGAVAP